MTDGLIQIKEAPITIYKKVNGPWSDWVVAGNIIDDKPDGYVRCISNKGSIYEGVWKGGRDLNGWGRKIQPNFCQIGWWKDGKSIGNCRVFDIDGTLKEEGWYENGNLIGKFKKDNNQYMYWEMKNDYFLNDSKPKLHQLHVRIPW